MHSLPYILFFYFNLGIWLLASVHEEGNSSNGHVVNLCTHMERKLAAHFDCLSDLLLQCFLWELSHRYSSCAFRKQRRHSPVYLYLKEAKKSNNTSTWHFCGTLIPVSLQVFQRLHLHSAKIRLPAVDIQERTCGMRHSNPSIATTIQFELESGDIPSWFFLQKLLSVKVLQIWIHNWGYCFGSVLNSQNKTQVFVSLI